MDGCGVVEASMECTNIRSACMDDRTLREFKDSMFDVYTMLGLGLESCKMIQKYLNSGRAMQLVMDSVCDPWEVFEVDWNYRFGLCALHNDISTILLGPDIQFFLNKSII